MNWQKLFASHILERGYDYYCDGAVENIEMDTMIYELMSLEPRTTRLRFP